MVEWRVSNTDSAVSTSLELTQNTHNYKGTQNFEE